MAVCKNSVILDLDGGNEAICTRLTAAMVCDSKHFPIFVCTAQSIAKHLK
jgi:hypothetical protein